MSSAKTESSALVVLTTLGSADDARTLVRRLVSDRLVACGTVLENANSIYWWNDELVEEPEAVVLLKTRPDCWGDLEKAVRELHPYEVPELLAIPIERGLPAYMEWLAGQTGEEAV